MTGLSKFLYRGKAEVLPLTLVFYFAGHRSMCPAFYIFVSKLKIEFDNRLFWRITER